MNKNIIIGIGGTGLTAIREIRRLIAERYEKGLQDERVASLRFLYIDTDEGDELRHQWSVLGKDISLEDGEKVIVTGDQLKPIAEHPEDYPEIASWLPRIHDFIGEPGHGAKGIRPYGRLIYEYSANKQRIKEKCVQLFDSLNENFRELQTWRFYLICGLSGGTGSGMFLPLSFDLLNDPKDPTSHTKWGLYQKGTLNQRFRTFLVLPPIQVVNRHNRYHSNAYAALLELNYYAFQPGGLPYDNCYLLEPQNASGNNIGLDNLPLLIAQRIFLNILGGAGASRVDSLMDNPLELGGAEGGEGDNDRHAICFSTFGLSAISHPQEIVAQCLAYKLAIIGVRSWLEPRDYERNINESVMTELRSMRLSSQHLFGDADPFSNNDYPDHVVELRNQVDQRIQAIGKKQLGENALQAKQSIENHFRDTGVAEFYRGRTRDVRGASDQALIAVRRKISGFLTDQDHGLEFTKLFTDELVKVLNDSHQQVSKLAGESQDRLVKTWQSNLSDTITQIRTNEQRLFYTDSRFHRDRTNLADALTQYLVKLADNHAARYGLEFLELVIAKIKELRAELDVWERRIEDARDSLEGTLTTILEDLEKGTRENGKIIFDESSLEELSVSTPVDVVRRAIDEQVQKMLNQRVPDLIELGKVERPQELIYEAAYEWVLSAGCPISVTRDSLYDKFISKYPESRDRQEILKKTRTLSEVFIKLSPQEVGRGNVLSTEVRVTTIPLAIGKILSDGRAAKTAIMDDLDASGTPAAEIQAADDPERMVFLQERQVFPLRFIETVAFMRGKYGTFTHRGLEGALHIDRKILDKLYDLYLLSQEQRDNRKKAEEAFLIGRISGWIVQKNNLHTRVREVRYEMDGDLGPERTVLGTDWEEAFLRFVKDSISEDEMDGMVRSARIALTARADELYKVCEEDEGKKSELLTAMQSYLKDRRVEYRAHEDDPRYLKDQAVLKRIRANMGSGG